MGLVTERGDDNSDENQPFMVAFLRGTIYMQPMLSKRSTPNVKRKRSVADEKVNYSTLMKEVLVDETTVTCRKHTMFISFKDLGWEVRGLFVVIIVI